MLPEGFPFHQFNYAPQGAYSRRLVRPSVSPYVPNKCPAHNFVISSRILKLFHRNVYHIESTCRVQNLGCYLEGQGHSMSLDQNRVRPITSLFGSQILKIFYRNDRNIEMTCRAQHLSCYLEGQVHSMTLQQNRFRPKTLSFEVGYFLQLFLSNYLSVSNTYSRSITRFNRLLFNLLKLMFSACVAAVNCRPVLHQCVVMFF